QLAERRQGGFVRDVARREEQRAFLAMKAGELGLELGVIMGVSADVAGAAGSRADFVKRFLHRLDDRRMLAHAEIIVRAPDGDRLGAVAAKAARVGEAALGPQDIDEHAIAALIVKASDRGSENAVVVQGACSRPRFSSRSLPIPLRTTRKNLERKDLTEAKSGEGAFERPPRHVSKDRDPLGRKGRPRLIFREMSDAAGNS